MSADPARDEAPVPDQDRIVGVVVTHRRRELLAASLSVLAAQTRPLDHLVVVDNADEDDV
ncbi:MAG: galactofuranosyl transferase, partial [Tomitella sp.]|nr:galactofuranosyl transferase [Tomitella sp.]